MEKAEILKLISKCVMALVLIDGIIILVSLLLPYINDIDIKILYWANPDNPIPILDEFIVFITDFSMASFSAIYVFWVFPYILYEKGKYTKEGVANFYKLVGIIGGIILMSAYFWADYEYKSIWILFGIIIILLFLFMARNMVRNPEKQKIYANLFGIMVLSIFLSNGISEQLIKAIVARPRPYSHPLVDWNLIREVPEGVTRSGYSYVSGHSSALFALLTPFIWGVKNRKIKITFFLWGVLHAFSRVYLAAHFPFCAFMGSLMGIAYGTFSYFLLRDKILNSKEQ